MRREDLIRMANQVAQFFDVYPPDQAAAEVEKHLRNFWDPRMRWQLLDHADAAELHPLVRQAIGRLPIPPDASPPSGDGGRAS